MAELECPRCHETRLTEVVTTQATREAYCGMCGLSWKFGVEVCHCSVLPIGHHHEEGSSEIVTACPTCGHAPWMTKPALAEGEMADCLFCGNPFQTSAGLLPICESCRERQFAP